MIKGFSYTQQTILALERSLSSDRLSGYLAEANGNKETALRLYSWNVDVSGALYAPLQGLEVALRNALHNMLSLSYSSDWYDNNRISLNSYAIDEIDKAKRMIARRNAVISPPNIVAELSFGFWIALLASNYHVSLWVPSLHKAFIKSQGKKRRDIYHSLNHLRKLRNRIAHHEPIFARHLSSDYASIITAIEWICPETAAWVDAHSRFHQVMQDRPA
jgi:Abi-like protein